MLLETRHSFAGPFLSSFFYYPGTSSLELQVTFIAPERLYFLLSSVLIVTCGSHGVLIVVCVIVANFACVYHVSVSAGLSICVICGTHLHSFLSVLLFWLVVEWW